MELKNGGQTNEIKLFHGTSEIFLELIYDSEERVDMQFTASCMWDYMSYFSVDMKYSMPILIDYKWAKANVSGHNTNCLNMYVIAGI